MPPGAAKGGVGPGSVATGVLLTLLLAWGAAAEAEGSSCLGGGSCQSVPAPPPAPSSAVAGAAGRGSRRCAPGAAGAVAGTAGAVAGAAEAVAAGWGCWFGCIVGNDRRAAEGGGCPAGAAASSLLVLVPGAGCRPAGVAATPLAPASPLLPPGKPPPTLPSPAVPGAAVVASTPLLPPGKPPAPPSAAASGGSGNAGPSGPALRSPAVADPRTMDPGAAAVAPAPLLPATAGAEELGASPVPPDLNQEMMAPRVEVVAVAVAAGAVDVREPPRGCDDGCTPAEDSDVPGPEGNMALVLPGGADAITTITARTAIVTITIDSIIVPTIVKILLCRGANAWQRSWFACKFHHHFLGCSKLHTGQCAVLCRSQKVI